MKNLPNSLYKQLIRFVINIIVSCMKVSLEVRKAHAFIWQFLIIYNSLWTLLSSSLQVKLAQLAGAVKYTNCISAEA